MTTAEIEVELIEESTVTDRDLLRHVATTGKARAETAVPTIADLPHTANAAATAPPSAEDEYHGRQGEREIQERQSGRRTEAESFYWTREAPRSRNVAPHALRHHQPSGGRHAAPHRRAATIRDRGEALPKVHRIRREGLRAGIESLLHRHHEGGRQSVGLLISEGKRSPNIVGILGVLTGVDARRVHGTAGTRGTRDTRDRADTNLAAATHLYIARTTHEDIDLRHRRITLKNYARGRRSTSQKRRRGGETAPHLPAGQLLTLIGTNLTLALASRHHPLPEAGKDPERIHQSEVEEVHHDHHPEPSIARAKSNRRPRVEDRLHQVLIASKSRARGRQVQL